tara:strand:- start:53 stop:232 length:180 start_codon:yes stop_codon:yes gene_type:complete
MLNKMSVKIMNISIAKEMNKIIRLKRVITKPARRQELDNLFNECLQTFITINQGVNDGK